MVNDDFISHTDGRTGGIVMTHGRKPRVWPFVLTPFAILAALIAFAVLVSWS